MPEVEKVYFINLTVVISELFEHWWVEKINLK